MNNINKRFQTFQQLTQNDFGKGQIYSVAYDTAWLARIPLKGNLQKPEYPRAIQWLLAHQLQDGSWGSSQPQSIHSNILSTLAAILALKQWPQFNVLSAVEKGLNALSMLCEQIDTHSDYETIGFELLLPSLRNELTEMNVTLPQSLERLYLNYKNKFEEKMALIKQYQQKYGAEHPASWWFSLEMLGAPQALNIPSAELMHMLADGGSVAASPAATAYLLAVLRYQGKNSIAAETYLTNITRQACTLDSLPNVAPIDEFELAFSVKYFFEAGLNYSEHPLLKNLISQLQLRWQHRHAKGIGYSSHFFTDPDCTANAAISLMYAGAKDIDPEILLTAFNGSHIETYGGERVAAVSTNIHVLQALRSFTPTEKIKSTIHALISWLEDEAQRNKKYGLIFKDKWHYSNVYATARAVIALIGCHDQLAQQCVDWLLEQQCENGGWGKEGFSNPEETGFASLALAYWYRHKKSIDVDVVKKALAYSQTQAMFPSTPLWIGKVLYCPRLVSASIALAGQLALSLLPQTSQIKINNSNTKLKLNVATDQWIEANLNDLPITNKMKSEKMSLALYQHYSAWVQQFDLTHKNSKLLNSDLAQASLTALQHKDSLAQEIFTDFSLLLLMLDDVLDTQWKNIQNPDAVFQAVITLFEGAGNDTVPSMSAFEPFFSAYADISHRLNQSGNDLKYFINSLKKYFHYLTREFNYRYHNQILNPDDYLQLRMIAGGTEVSCELAFVLHGLQIGEEIRELERYKLYCEAAFKALILANDLLSLQKERAHSHPHPNDNYVFLLEHEKVMTRDAIQQCADRYNQEVALMLQLKQELLDSPYHANDLYLALEIISAHIQAHLDWAKQASRYA